MTPDHTDKIASLLLVCDYADRIEIVTDDRRDEVGKVAVIKAGEPHWHYVVNPYSDSLESRRQENALEDYFAWFERDMWEESDRHVICGEPWGVFSMRARRLGRIRWCVEQMIENKRLM